MDTYTRPGLSLSISKKNIMENPPTFKVGAREETFRDLLSLLPFFFEERGDVRHFLALGLEALVLILSYSPRN